VRSQEKETSMIRTMLRASAALTALLAMVASTQAADWPTHAVKILIPFSAGGTADTLGRIVAQKLSEMYGQEFVPENKTGASGLIAAAEAANATPDGYTLFVSGVGGLIVASAISAKPPADVDTGYTHIALFGGPPSVLVVNNSVPAKTLKEFVDYAKANPGKLNYGSPSIGSLANLAFAAFQKKTGLNLQSVSYRGASQAMTDLIGGHIAVTSTALTSAAGTIEGGKVRALAVTARQRVAAYPNIPTYAEQGYPDMVSEVWFALSGPKGIPADIVNKLNEGVRKALQMPDVQKRLRHDAIDPQLLDAAGFTAFVKSENARWTPVARAAIGKK
jgi:tripartite-type tricarboxylate transporter receptor subunit TctC